MAEFNGVKLVTSNPVPKGLAPSELSEKAAPVEGFKPAVWQLSKK